jgi:hypothetical protein
MRVSGRNGTYLIYSRSALANSSLCQNRFFRTKERRSPPPVVFSLFLNSRNSNSLCSFWTAVGEVSNLLLSSVQTAIAAPRNLHRRRTDHLHMPLPCRLSTTVRVESDLYARAVCGCVSILLAPAHQYWLVYLAG